MWVLDKDYNGSAGGRGISYDLKNKKGWMIGWIIYDFTLGFRYNNLNTYVKFNQLPKELHLIARKMLIKNI